METINKTSSEILLEAANLLEQEVRWNRGRLFKPDASVGCKMCAHGAIAFCGNSTVKSLVLSNKLRDAYELTIISFPICSSGNYYVNLAEKENLTPQQYLIKYYGEMGLAAYKARKVGLTYYFNDYVATTKQDVINKLREAALL